VVTNNATLVSILVPPLLQFPLFQCRANHHVSALSCKRTHHSKKYSYSGLNKKEQRRKVTRNEGTTIFCHPWANKKKYTCFAQTVPVVPVTISTGKK
jgi:hypothetical protein